MTPHRQQYTAEFKQEAVRPVQSTGKSCAQIARDLGIPPHYVVRWRKQWEAQETAPRPVFTGRGVAAHSKQGERIKHLERELRNCHLVVGQCTVEADQVRLYLLSRAARQPCPHCQALSGEPWASPCWRSAPQVLARVVLP